MKKLLPFGLEKSPGSGNRGNLSNKRGWDRGRGRKKKVRETPVVMQRGGPVKEGAVSKDLKWKGDGRRLQEKGMSKRRSGGSYSFLRKETRRGEYKRQEGT